METIDKKNSFKDEIKNIERFTQPATYNMRGWSRERVPSYHYYKSKSPYYKKYGNINTFRVLFGLTMDDLKESLVMVGDYDLLNNNKQGRDVLELDDIIIALKKELITALKREKKPNLKNIERGRRLYLKYKNDEDFISEFFLSNFEIVEKRWFANKFIDKGICKVEDLINVTSSLL